MVDEGDGGEFNFSRWREETKYKQLVAKGTFQLQKKISITPWRQDFANGKSVFLVKSWCSSEELMQQTQPGKGPVQL